MILASIAEVISIGSIIPFLTLIVQGGELTRIQHFLPFHVQLDGASGLIFFGLLFIVASLLAGGIRILLLWVQTRVSYAIGSDFSVKIYDTVLAQPYIQHLSRNSSEVIAAISSKANVIVGGAVLPTLIFINSFIMLSMVLIGLLFIEPVGIVFSLGFIGLLYALIILIVRKKVSHSGQVISREEGAVIKALQEGLGGIRDVLLDGTQKYFSSLYKSADIKLRRAYANNQILAGAPRYIIETVGMVSLPLLIIVLYKSPDDLLKIVPIIGVLAISAQRLLPIMQQGFVSWSAIQGSRASLFEALTFLEDSHDAVDEKAHRQIIFSRSIIIDDCSFRYSSESPWILKDISLTIPKSARVGIIGRTGCGKTSLLNLLMGLIQPEFGKFYVDGVMLSKENVRSWQRHISHVPQDVYIADASVSENIAFGIALAEIDCVRIKEAAKKAQLSDLIESWPNAYQTVVGERGAKLSGGQRQRLGLARALYKQSDVIVLDEATSALDDGTERLVINELDQIDGDITIIMVAHRISTLQKCDIIFELTEQGIRSYAGYAALVSSKKETGINDELFEN